MRTRLLILAAATTSLVVVAFLIPLSILVRNLAQDRGVNEGLNQSQLVALNVGVNADPAALATVLRSVNTAAGITSSVWLPIGADGLWVGPTPPDPRSPSLTLARGTPNGNSREVTDAYAGGREIWVPVAENGGMAVVRTFVPASVLDKGVQEAVLVLIVVGVGMLVVAMLVADRLALRTARPVTALAATANRLAAGELGARAPIEGPREVIAVGVALNRLAQRIRQLLDAEREQVADLSHRLRTPVAAVRLASEALPKSPEAMRLTEHVDALERSVGDIIREARRGVRPEAEVSCDVVGVVRERVAFWTVLAEDQGRRLDLQLPDRSQRVKVSTEELAAAVDALLENVFAHTPEGTAMAVAVELEAGVARVTVADEGPGIQQAAVGRGHSGGGSTGLGLDIVRRTAESSGGQLEIGPSQAGGAAMVMRLGCT